MAHYETYDSLKSELYGIIICICIGKVIQENTREKKTANERFIYNIFYFCSNEMLHLLVDIYNKRKIFKRKLDASKKAYEKSQ